MTRYKLTLLFSFILSIVFTQNNSVLTGKITNPNNDKVYLQGFKGDVNGKTKRIMLDSATLDDRSRFVLRTKVDATTHVSLYDGSEYAQVLLAPEDSVHLTLNTAMFDETLRFYGRGAEKNNAVAVLALIGENHSKVINDLVKNDPTDSTKIFSKNDELAKAYIDIVESYQEEIPEFKDYGDRLIKQKEMSATMLKRYIRGKIEFQKKMKPLLGKEAIDFTGIDLEGNKTSLSDYKGKIIVVDFWATWCGPCKAEFPAYKELEKKYGEDINFVSVGVYCKEDAWRKMATNEGFSHNIFLSKKVAKQIKDYQVKTIPRYLVLNEKFELIDADAPRPSSGKLQQYWVK